MSTVQKENLQIGNMKILQINTDRGREAYELMTQKIREEQIDLCLIGEPNKDKTRDLEGDEDAKILILNRNLAVGNKGQGKGHTWVDLEHIRIISCYISPNSGIQVLEEVLDEITYTLRERGGRDALIGGDFNAKSWGWGESRQDRRGTLVAEWIGAENLVILNRGVVPTFRRRSQESIIDLTLCTENLAPKITEWEVLDDVETLSFHQYIQYEIKEETNPREIGEFKGWKVQTLDVDKLKQKVGEGEINNEYDLADRLREACDYAMRRVGTSGRRRENYWWNENIKRARTECIKIRR